MKRVFSFWIHSGGLKEGAFGVILNFMKESLCEPFFRFLRAGKVRRLVKKDSAVLDLGCGREGKFVKSLKSRVKTAVGIDKKAEPFEDGGISVQRGTFDGEPLPFADGTFDCVTMLAVIEHLKKRPETLKEARRVLKPGGLLVLTAPTWAAKPVLEFLAFRLGVVDKNEVADHKRTSGKANCFPFERGRISKGGSSLFPVRFQ